MLGGKGPPLPAPAADAAAHLLIIAFIQVPQTPKPVMKATETRAQGKDFVPPARCPRRGGCAPFVPAAVQRGGQQDVLHGARGLLPASAAPGSLSCSEQLASDSAKPGAGTEQEFPDLARAR